VITPARASVGGAGVDIEALLFAPARPVAAVVLVHGWGGSAQAMAEPANRLAELGYLAVAVSLRGWGGSGGDDDGGLAQPDDVAAVVAWLASGSPQLSGRIGVLGISQGGQVALLSAARSSLVAAVAAWAPVTDVASWRATTQYPGIPEYIDRVCDDGDLQGRSPLSFAADIRVPVLLVHGGADTRVPTDQSRRLDEAIRRSGGRCHLEVLDGVGHGRGPDGKDRAFDLTAAFFAEHLRG
jgi:dipeptidyl aminopeptidase/acylaminoacyl peptidase